MLEMKRVCIIHSIIRDISALYKYLGIDKDKLDFELIIDNEKPDYLICTYDMYCNKKQYEKFKKLYNVAKITIFIECEACEPDFNIFDYSFGFDANHTFSDRFCRIPTRQFYIDLIISKKNDIENDLEGAYKCLGRKNKFCNFIYSNSKGHWFRKVLFDEISKYKRVDSLGSFLNNTNISTTVDYKEKNWPKIIQESIDLRKNYKFSISAENATYDGYTSEKIFSALAAHTVPIYWGNRCISQEVNPNAFINCFDYDSVEALISEIIKIDNDNELWCKMITEPWVTIEQEEKEKHELEKLNAFFSNIFTQNLQAARRRGYGSAQESYERWFFKQGEESISQIISRILEGMKKLLKK